MNIKLWNTLLLGSALALTGFAAEKNENAEKISRADSKFLKEASEANQSEIKLGELAKERASSEEVKDFAEHMINDHRESQEQVTRLAEEKNVELPKKDMEDHTYRKLSKLSGAKFDDAYMDAMVKDHKKDVSEFEKACKKVQDQDVQSFANKTLPKLEEHLQKAKKLEERADKRENKA